MCREHVSVTYTCTYIQTHADSLIKYTKKSATTLQTTGKYFTFQKSLERLEKKERKSLQSSVNTVNYTNPLPLSDISLDISEIPRVSGKTTS